MFADGADILAFKCHFRDHQSILFLLWYFTKIAYIINLLQNMDQKANNIRLV